MKMYLKKSTSKNGKPYVALCIENGSKTVLLFPKLYELVTIANISYKDYYLMLDESDGYIIKII